MSDETKTSRLAHRVIPTILKNGSQLIKGQKFKDRVVGHAMQAAEIHGRREVDELMLIDVSATPKGQGPDFAAIEELSERLFVPLTVAGGITTMEQIKTLLRIGADKVCVCTAAIENPEFVTEAADHYGRQAIMVAIDFKGRNPYSHRATTKLGMDVVEWAIECERLGAGEILLTDIDRDGTMTGYNLAVIEEVSKAVSIPVIASGGCSGYDDMVKAIHAGASAVASGALFLFDDATPAGAAQYLATNGLEARV